MAILLRGTAVHKDGSKVNGSGVVSSSMGAERSYPKYGKWELIFEEKYRGKRVEIYLNGKSKESIILSKDQFLELVVD